MKNLIFILIKDTLLYEGRGKVPLMFCVQTIHLREIIDKSQKIY